MDVLDAVPLKFDRPNMPIALYTKITATWNISPKPVTTTYALPDTWDVLGKIRHSTYNASHEALCPGKAVPAWLFKQSTCTFTPVQLNPVFMLQTRINGTGVSNDYGYLKAAPMPRNGPCSSSYPPSATKLNTFRKVSSVTGACNHLLTGDKSVATFPRPRKGTKYSCGDTVLLSTSGNSNKAVKNAEDYCPGCGKDFRGTSGHMDDYSSSPKCQNIDDYGDYWTANTHGENKCASPHQWPICSERSPL